MSKSKPRTPWTTIPVAAIAAVAAFLALGVSTSAATVHSHGCQALKVNGLSVRAARAKAARAHCTVKLKGSRLRSAAKQTVAKDGASRRALTLWVFEEGCEMLPREEPYYTPGATALVTALHVFGGAPSAALLSGVPRCYTAWAGTVTVMNASGVQVATEHVAAGESAHIPLPGGEYTVEGVYDTATNNGQPAHSITVSVTVRAGETVRQDVMFSIP